MILDRGPRQVSLEMADRGPAALKKAGIVPIRPIDRAFADPTETGLGGDGLALPANRLASGECGLICEIDGDHEDVEGLKVMGICLGRRLHVIKRGDPMIVSVMGTRLGIAGRLACHVFVRRDGQPHCREDERIP